MPPRRAAAVSAANSLAASASANRSVSSAAANASPSSSKQTLGNGKARQSNGAAAVASSTTASSAPSGRPPAPVVPLSPIVVRLRTMWKFAAICQFLFTFDEAFGMSGFESEALEQDLDGTETRVVPDLMRRLLYTLTLNRNVDETNWEEYLRTQYIKRQPDSPLLGTPEETVAWHGLGLTQKVESIHQLCEWQLWDAERFRKLVKNDEDSHVWRIDPIGWDSEDNTYWLFDDNRLWVQHPPPAPPVAKAPPKKSSKKAKAEARREAQKRKRDASGPSSRTTAESTPSKAAKLAAETPSRSSPRVKTTSTARPPPRTGSRRSLRGRATDEWETIPAELLQESFEDGDGDGDSDLSDPPEEEDAAADASRDAEEEAGEGKSGVDLAVEENTPAKIETDAMEVDGEGAKIALNNGTELSVTKEDDEAAAVTKEADDPDVKMETSSATGADNPQNGVESEQAEEKPEEVKEPEWIEFEALAVTRQEWEWMSTRFIKSRHPDEKALHQLLKETVLPKVFADLEEAEKQRLHDLAMANRKRSSRIAIKESEREEKERDRIARQKMEEKMAAIREEEELQARREREELDAVRVREGRLREREERLLAREREAEEKALREAEERERREQMRELRKLKREQIIANGGHPPDDDETFDSAYGSPAVDTAEADDGSWELDCEVCGKHGVNLDDAQELVCCEDCGVWQHTSCWNAFDRSVGRPLRDWENEDFYCSRCKPPAPGQRRPQRPSLNIASAAAESRATATKQVTTPVVPSQGGLPSMQPPTSRPAPQQVGAIATAARPEGNLQSHPQLLHASSQGAQMPQHNLVSARPMQVPPQGPAQGLSQGAAIQPHQHNHQGSGHPYQQPQQQFTGGRPNAQSTYSPSPVPAQTSSHLNNAAPSPNDLPRPPFRPSASPNAQPVMSPSGVVSQPTVSPQPSSISQSSQSQNGKTGTYNGGFAQPSSPSPASSASPGVKPSLSGTGRSPQGPLPMRSPSSSAAAATSSVPRHVAHKPSGSFPIRHSTARSPLSGPHMGSPSGSLASLPAVSLGPPVRSSSPTPLPKQQSSIAARTPQLEQTLLHGRQTPIGTNGTAVSVQSDRESVSSTAAGPGPREGSLARSSSLQAQPVTNQGPSTLMQSTPAVPSAPAASAVGNPVIGTVASQASTSVPPLKAFSGASTEQLVSTSPNGVAAVQQAQPQTQAQPQSQAHM